MKEGGKSRPEAVDEGNFAGQHVSSLDKRGKYLGNMQDVVAYWVEGESIEIRRYSDWVFFAWNSIILVRLLRTSIGNVEKVHAVRAKFDSSMRVCGARANTLSARNFVIL